MIPGLLSRRIPAVAGPPPGAIIAAPAYDQRNAYVTGVSQAIANAAFTLNPDGTFTSTGDNYTAESGQWFNPITVGAGAAYDVRITLTKVGTAVPTFTNPAVGWVQLNVARTLTAVLATYAVGDFLADYSVKVEMRPTGGGATVSTGTFTLKMRVVATAPPTSDPDPSDGGDTSGAGCPTVDSVVPGGRLVGDLRVGDELLIADPNTGEEFFSKVTRASRSMQPCVRLHYANGVRVSCSTTGPIGTNVGKVLAMACEGVLARTRVGPDRIDSIIERVEDIGVREVVELEVGVVAEDRHRYFYVGDVDKAFGLHHNRKFEGM
jgi:hypothetical protein